MRFELHPLADGEAMEAAHWYENERTGLGDVFLDRLHECYRKIERSPHRFAKLETVQVEGEIRRVLLPKFPYIVIYEVLPDLVNVLAVAHASRRPDYWIKRRSPS